MRVQTQKYKRLISQCYDVPDGSSAQSQYSKLCAYCAVNPRRIPSIAEEIEERTQKSIVKKKYNMRDAFVSFDIMMAMMDKCDQYLSLMAAYLFRMVSYALNTDDFALKRKATDAFIAYSESPYHRDKVMESFALLHEFMSLCMETRSDPVTNYQSQLLGLKAILRYVRMDGNTDQFYNGIIPVLLSIQRESNSLSSGQQSGSSQGLVDGVVYTPKGLAEKILAEIASTTSAEKLHSLLEPVFEFFDHNDDWGKSVFCESCLTMITSSVRQDCEILVISHLIARLDFHRENPIARIGIAKAIHKSIGKVEEIHVMSTIQITDILLRQLQLSLSRSTHRPDQLEVEYQTLMMNCISRLSSLSSNPIDQDEVFFFILDRLSFMDRKGMEASGIQDAFLKTASEILAQHPDYIRERQAPPHICSTITDMLVSSQKGTRPCALFILQNVLFSTLRIGQVRPAQLVEEDYSFIYESLKILRDCALKPNTPRTFAIISSIYQMVLDMMRVRGILISFRLVLSLQAAAVQSSTIDVHHRNALHSIVVSYVWTLGRTLSKPILADYAKNVLEARRVGQQVSRDLWVSNGDIQITEQDSFTDTTLQHVAYIFDEAVLQRIILEPDTGLVAWCSNAAGMLNNLPSNDDALYILTHRHHNGDIETNIKTLMRRVSEQDLVTMGDAKESIRSSLTLKAADRRPSIDFSKPSYERLLSNCVSHQQQVASLFQDATPSLLEQSQIVVAPTYPSARLFIRDSILADYIY